jgi:molybdenum cofactor biosynthesis enzyme MoaA
MRAGASDDEIAEFIELAVRTKEKSHRINEKDFVVANRSMSFIGG